jgi:DnaA N-terminal domain/ClpX C4-type zinc finger
MRDDLDGFNGEKQCAWCAKSAHEVELLIEGHGCFICDACAELCATIVKEERSKRRAKAELAAREVERKTFSEQDLELRGFVENDMRLHLIAELGEDIYQSWFSSIELEELSDGIVYLSAPVKFIQKWIQAHYADELLGVVAKRFMYVRSICVGVRMPGLDRRRRVEYGGWRRSRHA